MGVSLGPGGGASLRPPGGGPRGAPGGLQLSNAGTDYSYSLNFNCFIPSVVKMLSIAIYYYFMRKKKNVTIGAYGKYT